MNFSPFLFAKKKKEEKETNKKDLYQSYFISLHFILIAKLTIRNICVSISIVCVGREREGEREGGRGREGEKGEERKSDEREVGGINDRRDKRFQGNRETNDNSLISSPIFFLDRTYAQDKLFVSG